jgi:hypothetical protein
MEEWRAGYPREVRKLVCLSHPRRVRPHPSRHLRLTNAQAKYTVPGRPELVSARSSPPKLPPALRMGQDPRWPVERDARN